MAWPALQALASLAAILGLLALSARLARRLMPLIAAHSAADATNIPPPLRIRATLALDSRRRLHLVQADAGQVLILTGGGTDAILAWPIA